MSERYIVCQTRTPDHRWYVWDTLCAAMVMVIDKDRRFNVYGYTDVVAAAEELASRRNLAEDRRTRRRQG